MGPSTAWPFTGWKVLLFGLWLLYFLSPVDLVPDVFPLIGWIDDLVVLGGLYWFFSRLRSAAGHAGSSRSDRDPASEPGSRPEEEQAAAGANPWQVLELSPGASVEEIAAAYKAQLLRYHPDRVAHLGDEFQRLAHGKTLEIQQAYIRLTRRPA
jgi:DnaJ like chaperone protein